MKYFSDIFHSQVNSSDSRWDQEFRMIPKLVTEEMNNMLIATFTEAEVKRALFQMHPSKALGLDGFYALFYQSSWEIVGDDVVKEVLRCLNSDLLDAELNETLIFLVPKKMGYMSLKLDMSKAYDRIEWGFLEKMMLSLGFAREWVKKVMLCVVTVSYRVKINDHIIEIIPPRRGLRQGDPISPYLFLICAEWLNYAMKEYMELGLLDGFRICKGAPVVTHLMFADDCMLFLKAKSESIRWIRDMLKRYEAISGQKINYTKSEAVGSKNMPQEMCRTLEETLQVKIVDAHSSYLGLPLIFSSKKAALFRTVKRISDWKHKLLSGAGREVLVKFVL
ncbi:hypothetical protein QQ045_001893 [Rhodiola kirilowii]